MPSSSSKIQLAIVSVRPVQSTYSQPREGDTAFRGAEPITRMDLGSKSSLQQWKSLMCIDLRLKLILPCAPLAGVQVMHSTITIHLKAIYNPKSAQQVQKHTNEGLQKRIAILGMRTVVNRRLHVSSLPR